MLVGILTDLYRKLSETAPAANFLDFFDRLGARTIVLRPFFRKLARQKQNNPTDEMRRSVDFFESNRSRVEYVLSILEDEESKSVLENMIKFRCYSKWEDLPKDSGVYNQYFFNDFFKYDNGEVLVDCGAFTGDSIRRFEYCMKRKHISNYSIVAFEPIRESYELLKRKYSEVTCINSGVYEQDCELKFSEENSGSKVSETGTVVVPVRAIDQCEECRGATLIKMDIEGAELSALKGAKETILRNHPKLAICIYHSNEDMLRIAEFIHELVPEYKLFIRQHTECDTETVLYATI